MEEGEKKERKRKEKRKKITIGGRWFPRDWIRLAGYAVVAAVRCNERLI
jgi:hypothetical protein